MLNLFKFTLPMLFGKTAAYRLFRVSPWYEHTDDDSKDKNLLGYKYDVGETNLLVRFTVKVEGALPAIDNSEVQASAAPIYVSFDDSRVTFYGNNLHSAQMSCSAGGITVIPAKTTVDRNDAPVEKSTAVKK